MHNTLAVDGMLILSSSLLQGKMLAVGVLRSIPLAPVSRKIADWVEEVNVRALLERPQGVGIGVEFIDCRAIVVRKQPHSSSWWGMLHLWTWSLPVCSEEVRPHSQCCHPEIAGI